MGLPQREGRPALSISPEDSIPDTASWDEDYGDVGMNPLNEPVPERKGKPDINGWLHVASDVTPSGDGGKGSDDAGETGKEKR